MYSDVAPTVHIIYIFAAFVRHCALVDVARADLIGLLLQLLCK